VDLDTPETGWPEPGLIWTHGGRQAGLRGGVGGGEGGEDGEGGWGRRACNLTSGRPDMRRRAGPSVRVSRAGGVCLTELGRDQRQVER